VALIAVGVSGGIGAYKAVEVCRGLQQRGHDVVAVMTRSAARFVGPVTFEAITRRPVITSQWRPGMNADIEHIAIADGIELLIVAPCTANIIGKFANGIADDFLTPTPPSSGTSRRWPGAACSSSIPVRGTWRADGSVKDAWPTRPTSSKPPIVWWRAAGRRP
jgi:hypothetical protein